MAAPDAPTDGCSAAELWRSIQPSAAELRAARRRLHAKALVIAALLAASYYTLVLASPGLLVAIAAAGVLTVAAVALATGVMHDANHGSFSKHRIVNRMLAYTSDVLGASSWLWRIQHNVLHHGNTNVVGYDADLELAPWARLAPTQPWRRRFRWQHVYLWPLYGFLAIKNLVASDLLSMLHRRIGARPIHRQLGPGVVARIVVGKLAHVSWALVIPMLFHPWWVVLSFYAASSWLVGFMLATIFQLAHCVDAAEIDIADPPRRGPDFVTHQLRTTVDIDSRLPIVGHAFRWIAGGLDHQIEHHLSPGLPHTIYPKLAARFRVACDTHQLPYRLHRGLWPALRSHTRWLRAMGRPPTPAI